MNAQTALRWEHYWGGTSDDGAMSLYPLGNGTLAVAGDTDSFGAGARDILFFAIAGN